MSVVQESLLFHTNAVYGTNNITFELLFELCCLSLEDDNSNQRADDKENGYKPNKARHGSSILSRVAKVLPFDVVWFTGFLDLWPFLEEMESLESPLVLFATA